MNVSKIILRNTFSDIALKLEYLTMKAAAKGKWKFFIEKFQCIQKKIFFIQHKTDLEVKRAELEAKNFALKKDNNSLKIIIETKESSLNFKNETICKKEIIQVRKKKN